jgi:hypothetical protein
MGARGMNEEERDIYIYVSLGKNFMQEDITSRTIVPLLQKSIVLPYT